MLKRFFFKSSSFYSPSFHTQRDVQCLWTDGSGYANTYSPFICGRSTGGRTNPTVIEAHYFYPYWYTHKRRKKKWWTKNKKKKRIGHISLDIKGHQPYVQNRLFFSLWENVLINILRLFEREIPLTDWRASVGHSSTFYGPWNSSWHPG